MNFVARLCRIIVLLAVFAIGLPVAGSGIAQAQSAQQAPAMTELWSPGESGQRMRIRGRVTSIDGTPLPEVAVRVRHADAEGMNWSYYLGEAFTNTKGIYQFGSVIPGNSHRLSHVHVYVDHNGYEYLETEFYFKQDPKASPDDPNTIFLEEGTVNGETMMFGRFDIVLIPQ